MKAKLYTLKGEMKQEVNLPSEYRAKRSTATLDQAIRVYEDNTHFGLSRVKTRSEVNLTKKKLYKQKGTGGARHGAKSAHIFVGGGVVHGPTGLKRKLNLPLKMKKVAKNFALGLSFKNGKAVLIEGLDKLSKTSEFAKAINLIINKLNLKPKVTVVLSNKNIELKKFLRNIKNIKTTDFESLNALDIVRSSTLLFDSIIYEVTKSKTKPVKKVTKKK